VSLTLASFATLILGKELLMRAAVGRMALVFGLMGGLILTSGAHGQSSRIDDAAAVRTSLAYLQARAAEWGIWNASEEFRLRQVVRDPLGQTHVRLDQVYQGVPVFGQQLIVHLDHNGVSLSVTGAYLAGSPSQPSPLSPVRKPVPPHANVFRAR
jgi:Fungalysin/Thermolysin Propeptide Motif